MGNKGQVLQQALTAVKKQFKKEKPKFVTEEKNGKEEKVDEERGIVYIGHIPHGFYEEQIKQFFKQFGQVQKVRVARSKKSGRSKGYAYVLFKTVSVAKVAAEAMNNYLMAGRRLIASYIPKEKQNVYLFFGEDYHEFNYPRMHNIKKTLASNRKTVKKSAINKKNKIVKKKLLVLQETLKSKGINLSLETV